jgi:DnaK suppressor protein
LLSISGAGKPSATEQRKDKRLLFSAVSGAETMARTRKEALKKLREILLQRREALVKALAGDNSLLNEMSQQAGGDVIDFALDSASDEIFSRLAEAESRELAHIQYALEKLDEGTYGNCESCEKSIPLTRLQALPYATLCIDCKRKVEQGIIAPGSAGGWVAADSEDAALGDMDINFS